MPYIDCSGQNTDSGHDPNGLSTGSTSVPPTPQVYLLWQKYSSIRKGTSSTDGKLLLLCQANTGSAPLDGPQAGKH